MVRSLAVIEPFNYIGPHSRSSQAQGGAPTGRLSALAQGSTSGVRARDRGVPGLLYAGGIARARFF